MKLRVDFSYSESVRSLFDMVMNTSELSRV